MRPKSVLLVFVSYGYFDIRSGKIQAWAEVGKFEAMVRQTDKNEYSVFTRCIYVKKGVDFDE